MAQGWTEDGMVGPWEEDAKEDRLGTGLSVQAEKEKGVEVTEQPAVSCSSALIHIQEIQGHSPRYSAESHDGSMHQTVHRSQGKSQPRCKNPSKVLHR